MPHLVTKFFEAKKLRNKGYSIKEISEKLDISKSTASVWLRDFKLSSSALKRLEKRRLIGRIRSIETKKRKREGVDRLLRQEALNLINSVNITKKHLQFFCALLFCCEGAKDTRYGISFINSDPIIIKAFLTFLRDCFNIEEKRLRIVLYLHDYHSPRKQISLWSKVTDIPPSQFIKPYIKPHTEKRIKDNYPGCASIRYYDSLLARKLSALAQELLNKYGGVG